VHLARNSGDNHLGQISVPPMWDQALWDQAVGQAVAATIDG
jgi:hypothetical protein